jgi:hypothetical protein
MAKKLFIGVEIIAVISLFFSVYSFATNEDSKTVNLGNEVSKTIDKTEDNVENAADKTGNAGQRLVNDVKTDMGAMFNNNNNNDNDNNNKSNNAVANNNNVNYSTARTATNGNVLNTGMSSTTWVWIIMAVAAIIIIAAVWYYAAQNNTRSNS